MVNFFCFFGKKKPKKKKEEINLLSQDELSSQQALRNERKEAGIYFNSVPYDILQHILDFCGVESLKTMSKSLHAFK